MRWRTIGQNVPFFGSGIFDVIFLGDGVALICVLPLSTASASIAFVFISSSRSLLVQNHISSGVAFSMYFVPFWISCGVCALFMRAVARPIL